VTSATDDILASIDGALTACGYIDFGETGSSMRWRPEPPPEPERKTTDGQDDEEDWLDSDDTWGPFTVRLHFRVPHKGWNVCLKAEARSAEQMPVMVKSMRDAYRKMRGWYPRPASRCDECNPRGNPEPLAVDGRAYQRRLRNRRRRR